jgi:hypothetical protein
VASPVAVPQPESQTLNLPTSKPGSDIGSPRITSVKKMFRGIVTTSVWMPIRVHIWAIASRIA